MPDYPTRDEQMASAPAAYIEKDQVQVFEVDDVLATEQHVIDLGEVASSLDKVLVEQWTYVEAVANVPGTNVFRLDNPSAEPSIEGFYGEDEYNAWTSLDVVDEVIDNVPGFTVTVVWPAEGEGVPANGEDINIGYKSVRELERAALDPDDASLVDLSDCDFEEVTGTTLTVLYATKIKSIFNLEST